MFSGIVEEIGVVVRNVWSRSGPLTVRCSKVLAGTRIGDSVAVNGVCLTVADVGERSFTAHVLPVTRQLSNLDELRSGDPVNLERAVAAGQRLGGHYVQGHVDGVGRIASTVGQGPSIIVRLTAPPALMRYVVERGFVAIDGASLTVVRLRLDGFDVSLVYHTQQSITLPRRGHGSRINIEVDVIAKYVERLVGDHGIGEGVTMSLWYRSGYV